jgi:catechol 2,3-dioxygenase-like lactoylglutathione lyase family enzyme
MTDRSAIIARLEHVNLTIPDQLLATQFYIVGLGLTRDPAMTVGLNNMWVNIGRSQFHLPTSPRGAQILRGQIRITLPDLGWVAGNLGKIGDSLGSTAFSMAERDDGMMVTCPWGNRILVAPPAGHPGATELGLSAVLFDVPQGSAEGIAAFYRDVVGTNADCSEKGRAVVPCGPGQALEFRETAAELPDWDGHHIQIYVADFDRMRARMTERGLVTSDDGPFQFRFADITDPGSGKPLYQVEHEVRSLDHPLFGRPLYNRNPKQVQMSYRPGQDAFAGVI